MYRLGLASIKPRLPQVNALGVPHIRREFGYIQRPLGATSPDGGVRGSTFAGLRVPGAPRPRGSTTPGLHAHAAPCSRGSMLLVTDGASLSGCCFHSCVCADGHCSFSIKSR